MPRVGIEQPRKLAELLAKLLKATQNPTQPVQAGKTTKGT